MGSIDDLRKHRLSIAWKAWKVCRLHLWASSSTMKAKPETERHRMSIRFERGNKPDAFAVRTAVFMDEQGFENEFEPLDEIDSTIHVTMYAGDELVGCARVFPDTDDPARYVFGRLAVLPPYRKNGYGGLLLEESERCAREAGAREMHLHAQCYITGFYHAYGYAEYGDVELDEHVEHIWMKKAL